MLNKFVNKRYKDFSLHLNNVSTLPCKTRNCYLWDMTALFFTIFAMLKRFLKLKHKFYRTRSLASKFPRRELQSNTKYGG